MKTNHRRFFSEASEELFCRSAVRLGAIKPSKRNFAQKWASPIILRLDRGHFFRRVSRMPANNVDEPLPDLSASSRMLSTVNSQPVDGRTPLPVVAL